MPMTRSSARARSVLAALSLLPLGLLACSAPPAAPPQAAAPALPLVSDAYVAHRDPQLGVPTLVWLESPAQPAAGADARGIAWRVLNELAPTYGLSAEALQTAQLRGVHDIGRGAVIAQFEQDRKSVV